MTVMQNHVKSQIENSSAEQILFELQVEQHHHDELYHREIARLSMHNRLNHMALHFAKYTGKIASTTDAAAHVAILVDVLVIAISTANILNTKLWDIVADDSREHQYPGLLAFGRSLASRTGDDIRDHASFLKAVASASGRIAAACEKIDHLEDVPYRAEIKLGIAALSTIALSFISRQGIDPSKAVRERLAGVKHRLVLHNRV